MTNSDEDARKIAARLEKVPEVLRVMSLETFVPEDQPAKLKLIAQGAKVLDPALNPDSIDDPPSDAENVEALKGSAASLRKTAGDAKGPGAVASRRLADALSKLAEFEPGHARQDPGHFRQPVEGGARPAQEFAAGPAGQPEDAAAGSGRVSGRPRTACSASRRCRAAIPTTTIRCASLPPPFSPPSRTRSAGRSRFSNPATPS